jgi:CAAX prenyl protease-like protein
MTQQPADTPSAGQAVSPASSTSSPSEGALGPQWWLPYVLPFLVYMLVGAFEPAPPLDPLLTEGVEREPTLQEALGIKYEDYPTIYTIKIGLTVLTMLIMVPAYRKFPFRVSWLAIVVGIVGVVLWIALCWLHLERFLASMGLGSVAKLGERPAFNPFKQLADQGGWMYGFLAIRFVGLALVVPVIEEFFLRGWLMRYIMHPDWWKIPFGKVNLLAVVVGTGVPMLMHPGELLAAAVWFSMVTWLMIRTKNIWDCVAAHAVTNLLLGIFVVSSHWWSATGWWWLW